MAMKSTSVALNVKGVNKTGAVFKQIAASAARIGATVAAIGAGAFAAFAATAKKLGALSDVAMQASSSAKELTQLSSALDVLGIKSKTPEQLAMAFQRMTKATGETGVKGFKNVIAEISKMTTAEERSAAAMATFGRSGLDFMPLIEAAAKDGVGALEDVMNAMPGISDSAAEAGDKVSDAMTIMTNTTKSLWGEAMGAVSEYFDSKFAGGIREAAMKGAAYMEYWCKRIWREVNAMIDNIALAYHAMAADWGETFSQMFTFIWEAAKSTLKYVWEQIKNVGAVVRDFIKECWSGLSGEGFEWSNVVKNADFADAGRRYLEDLKRDWAKVSLFDNVEWAHADLTDLEENLQDKLAKASKAAAAVSSAAVAATADQAAEDTGKKIKKAMKNEWLEQNTYKAATMSLRADYGKAEDKTVRAVNGVKAVNARIAAATLKTANAIEALETV